MRRARERPVPTEDDALVQLSLTTRADRPHNASILATAALLFACVFALCLAITEPEAALGFMFVLPIALLALHFGAMAGLSGAGVATALVALLQAAGAMNLGVAGYVARIVTFVLTGGLVGIYAERRTPYAERHTPRDVIMDHITEAFQPDSVLVVDAASGEIIFSNKYAERVVGRRLSDVADDFPMFHLDGRPYSFAERQVPRTISSGEQIVDEDFFAPDKEGGRVRWRCSCWPVYGDGGGIVAAVAVTRDVTEQTRQHERLAYLSALLENSEDAVVATDERYFVTVWNKGAERLYGRIAAEAVGLHADTVARANLSAEQRTEWRRQLAENGHWRGEVAVTREDRTTADVEVSTVALRGQHGDVTGYLGIHRDISERKRAEEVLRESQRRTETILESISDEFFAVDREWRFTYVNERALAQARRVAGRDLTAADLLGVSLWEQYPQMVGTTLYHEAHRAMRDQAVVELEVQSPFTGRWLEARMYPSHAGLSIYVHDVSERKRAEEERAYHAILVAHMEDAVIATDHQWLVTAWNPGAEKLYGRTVGEVLGRPVGEVVQAKLSDAERADWRRQVTEARRSRVEIVAYGKDGTPLDVEVVSVAIQNQRGEISGYLSIHRDVSERKRAERKLREAQRRSETILESISDDFVAVDRDWRYTYINDRALRSTQEWLGWPISREELLGRSLWEVFPETVGTVPYVKYHQAVREGRSVEFETYFAANDSWFETHVYPSKSGLSIYFRTITERKRAEEEARRREVQQALVADLGLRALATDDLPPLMDDAVALVAQTLDVELVGIVEILPGRNQMLLRAGVGWTEREVGEVAEVTAAARPGSLIHYTIVSGEPVVSEDLSADDRFEVSPIVVGTGAVSGATVVIGGRDEPFGSLGVFSRARRTFSARDLDFLQAVANVLATAVERAQAEGRLDEVRDMERRRIARDLHDEALQDLTHALALAQGAGSSNGADALVPALKRVGEQLRGVIYDLRLEEQEGRPLRAQLEALVAFHDAMAADCDIELDMLEGTPTTSLGHPGVELLRIVGEALTNARRHSSAGHVRVKTWGSEQEFRVEVADDGVGFDPAAAPPREGGTGIKGMGERAALIGADLTITSEPGAGSRVRVRLALVDDHPPERIRVLLVEDHAAVREAIAAMLEREPDFNVTAQAASLADARDLLDNVDVAVIDLSLPDGYGGDLIKELRAVNRHAQALVLSGSLDRADIARAVESGAAGALNKTIHLDELVDAVRRLRRGETLLPLDEVIALLRYAIHEREREYQDRQAIAQLTPRERDVLQALAEGLDSQAIADRLHISLRTERNHAANILAKLGVHSQLQALVFALRYGVVEIR